MKENYNRKYKEWVDGDTFAFKIKLDCPYKNRYLILIRYENREWEACSDLSFRVKITLDNILPVTKEQLENLDYIIVRLTSYEDRLLPVDASEIDLIKQRSKVKFYPDEYGNLNVYTFDLHFERKALSILDEMVYLGNFKLKTPEDEYIPFDRHNAGYYLLSRFEENMILEYENYNLRKSIAYDRKSLKSKEELKTFIPPDPKKILEVFKELGIDFNQERQRDDSLTYVGGEEKSDDKY